MTLLIGYKCDICGTILTEEYTGQTHKSPEGWGSFTAHFPICGPNHQLRDMCPKCTKALYEGKPLVDFKW